MQFLLQLTATGLFAGMMYGLVAMSLALVFKATGILNFAQGELLMLVAYIASSVATQFGLSFIPLLLVTMPIAMLVGVMIDRWLIRPMAGEPMFSVVMVTMGVAIVIRAVVVMAWGPAPRVFDAGLPPGFVQVGIFSFQQAQLVLLASTLAVGVLIFALMKFSRVGIAMRAIASNERSALLMGIDVPKVQSLAWALASAIAGLAGILMSAIFALNADIWLLGFRAFPAVVLGGIDAPLGALVGGLSIGLIENYAQAYIGQGMREIAGFAVIIVVLMIRPNGLFGSRTVTRV